MASTFTSNLAIEQPANGDYVGTWDVPVNSNMSIIDLAVGTTQTINLAAGSVTLSTAQTRSANLTFTGNLVGNVTVTIPNLSSSPATVVSGKSYTIQNQCGNSSAFTVTLTTTDPSKLEIGCPPYEPFDIMVEGTGGPSPGSIRFRNLGPVGSYWDYAGSSVPAWVTTCSVPPYLNCDGTTFSSATYPALATILGGTTLPDSRGRARFANNQGTSRITTAGSGINGDTNFSGGGAQNTTIGTSNLPPYTPSGTVGVTLNVRGGLGGAGGFQFAISPPNQLGTDTTIVSSASFTGTAQGGTSVPINNIPPGYIGGLCLIRAA
jgi:Phage Tail Collar Domain